METLIDTETVANSYLKTLADLPRLDNIDYKFSAVSLFSGGGGLDLGVSLAGFEVVFSSDIEMQLGETVKFNVPEATVLAKDIRELKANEIRLLTERNEFDLLIGGPPCQSFSILGKRESLNDPRGMLVYEYARLIKEVSPRAFLFENVPGILTVNKGKDWNELLEYIEKETKYQLYTKVLNAADYGIPQIRKRVFIIGFKEKNLDFEFPEPSHHDCSQLPALFGSDKKCWVPAKFALDNVDGLANHDIRIHGDRVYQRYSEVPVGERDKVDRTDRIDPDRPSGTVLVGSKAGGGRPFIHPYEPRHITVREAARLQSFPDWYEFQNTGTWQYRAVGNAVPPLLAKYIAEKIVKSLS